MPEHYFCALPPSRNTNITNVRPCFLDVINSRVDLTEEVGAREQGSPREKRLPS